MSAASQGVQAVGTIATLWRYPVKSMLGEELSTTAVTERGLLGDRAYALLDTADGKVVTAKNPRKWPEMLSFHAAYLTTPQLGQAMPPVRITLPDGATLTSDQPDRDQLLSRALSRAVTCQVIEQGTPEAGEPFAIAGGDLTAEQYWPDIAELDYRDTVTDFDLPGGTFFDCASVHLLTMSTLARLHELYSPGRFEVRRFRPNIVVDTSAGLGDFVENSWIGRLLAIGDAVRLRVTAGCPRCVMTTLPQGDLPRDNDILRTATRHNRAVVGVYAAVVRGGMIRRGDAVRLAA